MSISLQVLYPITETTNFEQENRKTIPNNEEET